MPSEQSETSNLPEVVGQVHISKPEDRKVLNNPECVHEMIPDPSEQTEHFFGIVCKWCGRGKLIKKH